MKQGSRGAGFRPDIEGLRAIAVLLVVAFHCGLPGLSGGFVGVDVFFVLSGYLVTGLLVAEIYKTTKLDLLQFYARRARRLLPASALTTIVTVVCSVVVLAPYELAFAGRAARATSLYLSNVFFSINSADYFSPSVETNPMLHTWSLAVEEQFYFIWPLLVMAALQARRSRKILVAALSVVTVASLAVSVWSTAHSSTFAFYELPARAWEFGVGGLAVLLPLGALSLSTGFWLGLGWLGTAVIVGAGHFISGDTQFPGWIALVPVIGTVTVLIACAERPRRGVAVLLNSRPLQVLGTISYSWYLWHWPFLVLAAALVPHLSVPEKVVAAAAALVVAELTHACVENPIRFSPRLIKRPALSLCLAGAVTVGSLSVAFLSIWFAHHLENRPEMQAISASIEDVASMNRPQCVSQGDSPEVKTCAFGSPSSASSIALFGDSHAYQWFNPLRRIAETRGVRLTTFVKSACHATDVTPGSGSSRTNCERWRKDAIRQIIATRPSIVFIGNYSGLLNQLQTQDIVLSEALAAWKDGTRRTLAALTGAGLRVALIRDNPTFSFDVPTCLARSLRHPWYFGFSCDMDRAASLNPAVFAAETEAAQGLPDVHLIDLTDRFCQDRICSATRKGVVMYRDGHHLTGRFAESLTPALETELLPMLGIQPDDRDVPAENVVADGAAIPMAGPFASALSGEHHGHSNP